MVKISGTNDPAQDGREVLVCCLGCSGKLTKDPARYLAKLDELIIKEQAARYPLTTCLVQSSNELPDMQGPDAGKCYQAIYKNRLVRMCCGGCFKTFKNDPAKYMATLDAAAIEKQSRDYPLKVCIISGRALGENPRAFLMGDRLVKTCCGNCKKTVEADPRTYMRKIDAARKSASPSGTLGTGNPKTVDGVPSTVHGAIIKRYPSAKIMRSELDDGIWEVDIVTAEGTGRNLELSPDGWILDDDIEK